MTGGATELRGFRHKKAPVKLLNDAFYAIFYSEIKNSLWSPTGLECRNILNAATRWNGVADMLGRCRRLP